MGRADPRAVIGKLLSVRQSVALAGSVNRRLRSEFDGRRKSHPLIMCAGLSVITANAPGIVAYPRTEEEVAALLDRESAPEQNALALRQLSALAKEQWISSSGGSWPPFAFFSQNHR